MEETLDLLTIDRARRVPRGVYALSDVDFMVRGLIMLADNSIVAVSTQGELDVVVDCRVVAGAQRIGDTVLDLAVCVIWVVSVVRSGFSTAAYYNGDIVWSRLRYSTFIKPNYINSPAGPCRDGYFGGDGRDFAFEGSARTRVAWRVNWLDGAGNRGALPSLRVAVGETRLYDKNYTQIDQDTASASGAGYSVAPWGNTLSS